MAKDLIIDGRNVRDIPSFYAEINRVFMADEDWTLANSLDALNDLFYGGFGAIEGREQVRLVWQDMATSRSALGAATTRAFLEDKLLRPDVFNTTLIEQQIEALDRGVGQTYFEIVLEIIGDHPNIELVGR